MRFDNKYVLNIATKLYFHNKILLIARFFKNIQFIQNNNDDFSMNHLRNFVFFWDFLMLFESSQNFWNDSQMILFFWIDRNMYIDLIIEKNFMIRRIWCSIYHVWNNECIFNYWQLFKIWFNDSCYEMKNTTMCVSTIEKWFIKYSLNKMRLYCNEIRCFKSFYDNAKLISIKQKCRCSINQNVFDVVIFF